MSLTSWQESVPGGRSWDVFCNSFGQWGLTIAGRRKPPGLSVLAPFHHPGAKLLLSHIPVAIAAPIPAAPSQMTASGLANLSATALSCCTTTSLLRDFAGRIAKHCDNCSSSSSRPYLTRRFLASTLQAFRESQRLARGFWRET